MKCKCEHCGWENSLEKVYCDNCRRPLVKDVFISYSRKDYVDSSGKPFEGNILSTLKSFLLERGISFWFDEEGIFSGDEFAGILAQAIRSSRVFLFVSSVNSNKSPWTSREISVALLHKKVIIPFRIDDSPYNDSIALKISDLDRIDYSNSHGLAMAKLERALRHHLPVPPTVDLQTGQESSDKRLDSPKEETSSHSSSPSNTASDSSSESNESNLIGIIGGSLYLIVAACVFIFYAKEEFGIVWGILYSFVWTWSIPIHYFFF